MKVTASYQFDAPAPDVWRTLTDTTALAGCIPGCEGLESIGDDQYKAVIVAGIGPVRGRFNAKISMLDQVPNQSYRLAVEGSGGGGFINGEALVTLVEENGKTTVQVDGDSHVGGPVARVGQRMMDSVAKTMMDRFFTCLQEAAK